MLKHSEYCFPDDRYFAKPDLDNLLRRLKKGMVLKGRIVECLGGDKYLLRIWGYNIFTESRKTFQQFDEIELTVIDVKPRLILDLRLENQSARYTGKVDARGTNILVF